jgi:hypothetical protein
MNNYGKFIADEVIFRVNFINLNIFPYIYFIFNSLIVN